MQAQVVRFVLMLAGLGLIGWMVPESQPSQHEGDDRKRNRRALFPGGEPIIQEVKPTSARVGEKIKIKGYNFGPETPVVTFNGISAALKKVEFDELRVFVPSGAATGPLVVTVGERTSNAIHFVVEASTGVPPVSIASAPTPVSVKADSTNPVASDAQQTVSFAKNVQPIFDRSCTSCHGGSAGMFLDEGESYANLMNVQAQKGCTSEKRVLPGNSSASVLFKRISGTSCGTQMPKKAPPLSPGEIQLIRDWIDQGAPNN